MPPKGSFQSKPWLAASTSSQPPISRMQHGPRCNFLASPRADTFLASIVTPATPVTPTRPAAIVDLSIFRVSRSCEAVAGSSNLKLRGQTRSGAFPADDNVCP
eukprot:scaffold37347_cov72-Phaeocystis_antarctica.AAC.3